VIVPSLPPSIVAPSPFPAIVAQAAMREAVAPGIARARYDVRTADGPLAIEVVAIDPREPTVRLGAVVAHDRLVSAGETVSAMAHRTDAVAGINADYFDIGQTNEPLGVVVRNGTLVRTPSKRIALVVGRNRSVRFERVAFSGSISYAGRTMPLTAVGEWPPQGGATLVGPGFGPLRPSVGLTTVALAPMPMVPTVAVVEPASSAGTYRASTVGPDDGSVPSGPTLGLGPAALAFGPPPVAGDAVTVVVETTPPLASMLAAVGGGPLLVADGALASDPFAPAPEERDVRFPVAGAATTADGTLLLVTVDGRAPALSIGVTRPQFAALLLGLGATDGMAFDSGGSATLVARVLGEPRASVLGAPSDGEERPVADGLFAFSDAPVGPASALVVRPASFVALAGARVPVAASLIDAAGHDLGAVPIDGGPTVPIVTGESHVRVSGGGRAALVPVRAVERLSSLTITSDARTAAVGSLAELRAVGTDSDGAPVTLGDGVGWSARDGAFVAPGRLRVRATDASVVAVAGGLRATFVQRVGSHEAALAAFVHSVLWSFASFPSSLVATAGSTTIDGGSLSLAYDFSAGATAAYATTSLALPGEPLAFSIVTVGNDSGIGLRAAFTNRFGERRALWLAKRVDWSGARVLTVALPADLNAPVRLVSLYAIPAATRTDGTAAVRSGHVVFRSPAVTLAGSPSM